MVEQDRPQMAHALCVLVT